MILPWYHPYSRKGALMAANTACEAYGSRSGKAYWTMCFSARGSGRIFGEVVIPGLHGPRLAVMRRLAYSFPSLPLMFKV